MQYAMINHLMTTHETIRWPDEVDEILAGDIAVALASVTPAKGVVIAPLTNFGMRDREAGTICVNSSVAAWRKLDRIRRNPGWPSPSTPVNTGRAPVPSTCSRRAGQPCRTRFPTTPPRSRGHWQPRSQDRGAASAAPWKRWLRVYALRDRDHASTCRARSTVWPDLGLPRARPRSSAPRPLRPPVRPGARPPRAPGPAHRRRARGPKAAQAPPARPPRAPGRARDGLPDRRRRSSAGDATDARHRPAPAGADLVPPGGRRAGLTAHWFAPRVVGQRQRTPHRLAREPAPSASASSTPPTPRPPTASPRPTGRLPPRRRRRGPAPGAGARGAAGGRRRI